MKKFCYIAVMTMANAWMLCAQTNAIPNLNTNTIASGSVRTNATNAVSQILALVTTNPPAVKPPVRETVIEAAGPADFHQVAHGLRVIYRDHVRVDSPGLKLTCEWLAADVSQASGRVTNIVAKTNVVIDAIDDRGQKMHATGDKLVYVYSVQNGVTNDTVTLSGKAPRAEYKGVTLTGNPIVWDRIHDSLTVQPNPKTKMVFQQNIMPDVAGANSRLRTNAAVARTNSLIVETNLPAASTNQTLGPK